MLSDWRLRVLLLLEPLFSLDETASWLGVPSEMVQSWVIEQSPPARMQVGLRPCPARYTDLREILEAVKRWDVLEPYGPAEEYVSTGRPAFLPEEIALLLTERTFRRHRTRILRIIREYAQPSTAQPPSSCTSRQ